MTKIRKRWATVGEAAEYLGLSRGAIYNRISRKLIPFSRDGNRVWIDLHGVNRRLSKTLVRPETRDPGHVQG